MSYNSYPNRICSGTSYIPAAGTKGEIYNDNHLVNVSLSECEAICNNDDNCKSVLYKSNAPECFLYKEDYDTLNTAKKCTDHEWSWYSKPSFDLAYNKFISIMGNNIDKYVKYNGKIFIVDKKDLLLHEVKNGENIVTTVDITSAYNDVINTNPSKEQLNKFSKVFGSAVDNKIAIPSNYNPIQSGYLSGYAKDKTNSDITQTFSELDKAFTACDDLVADRGQCGGITKNIAQNNYTLRIDNKISSPSSTTEQSYIRKAGIYIKPNELDNWVMALNHDGSPVTEGQSFVLPYNSDVIYGASSTMNKPNGISGTDIYLIKYAQIANSTIVCNTTTFGGDPSPNTNKYCYYKRHSKIPSNYIQIKGLFNELDNSKYATLEEAAANCDLAESCGGVSLIDGNYSVSKTATIGNLSGISYRKQIVQPLAAPPAPPAKDCRILNTTGNSPTTDITQYTEITAGMLPIISNYMGGTSVQPIFIYTSNYIEKNNSDVSIYYGAYNDKDCKTPSNTLNLNTFNFVKENAINPKYMMLSAAYLSYLNDEVNTRQRMLEVSLDKNAYKQKMLYAILAIIIFSFLVMIATYVYARKG